MFYTLRTVGGKDLTFKQFIGTLPNRTTKATNPKEILRVDGWLLVHRSRYVSRSMLAGFPLSDNPTIESLSASILPAHLSGQQ